LKQHQRAGFDVANLEQMWSGYLGMDLKRSLLSVHHLELIDLAGVKPTSFQHLVSKHLMQRAERFIVAKSQWIRATTSRLSKELARLNPSAQIFTAPVAIDPELYKFALPGGPSETIGLIASFNWTPGLTAAVRLLTRVWPRIKSLVPTARLSIVGWHARAALAQFACQKDVTIIENVPDTTEYFRRLAVLVYPLSQGSGMKIKLLEAMALGIPVVTTAEGAEGLAIENGHHAFVDDDDDGLARCVVELIRNRSMAERMARAARALVEEQYSPVPVVSKLEDIYQQVMTGDV
jgi:glycosyltransferase involved in cell wall biosynthesis